MLDTDLIKQVLVTDTAEYEVADLNKKYIRRFAPDSLIVTECCKHAELRGYLVSPERLATGRDVSTHPQARRILETVETEVGYTLGSTRPYFTWLEFSSRAARLTVRILLGPNEGRDEAGIGDMRLVQMLKQLMYSATRFFGRRSRYFDRYYCVLRKRMRGNAKPSLIGTSDLEHASEAQVTFWMMALNGGLDTTLPRTLALILSHQSVYTEVLEELDGIDLKNPTEIDRRLSLLEGCILETIRLWTVTPLINRKRLKDGTIGEYTIYAGTQVLIPAAYIHRDPAVYGETANQFNPHRWLMDPCPDGMQFGLGSRSCAGRDIALFVIKASLAHIIRHRKLILNEPSLTSAKEIPDLFNHLRMRIKKN